ncbi:hypothetical protein CDAR_533601 [Caerostris darwini]|uniref:Uncharacterized protein n=1 Tax=Caerostris darwini TaxID=1538125 RepID=A0AAV4SAH2_9ARAC|nr:hypothetical protein CDAR_533601 [Caerostris darwini]
MVLGRPSRTTGHLTNSFPISTLAAIAKPPVHLGQGRERGKACCWVCRLAEILDLSVAVVFLGYEDVLEKAIDLRRNPKTFEFQRLCARLRKDCGESPSCSREWRKCKYGISSAKVGARGGRISHNNVNAPGDDITLHVAPASRNHGDLLQLDSRCPTHKVGLPFAGYRLFLSAAVARCRLFFAFGKDIRF